MDLGLIYDVMVRMDGLGVYRNDPDHAGLPGGGIVAGSGAEIVSLVPGVSVVLLNLVWSPPGRGTAY